MPAGSFRWETNEGLFDPAPRGNTDFRLDAACPHAVEAVVKVGDDAGVVGQNADAIAMAKPEVMATQLTVEAWPACANAGTARHSADRIMNK